MFILSEGVRSVIQSTATFIMVLGAVAVALEASNYSITKWCLLHWSLHIWQRDFAAWAVTNDQSNGVNASRLFLKLTTLICSLNDMFLPSGACFTTEIYSLRTELSFYINKLLS